MNRTPRPTVASLVLVPAAMLAASCAVGDPVETWRAIRDAEIARDASAAVLTAAVGDRDPRTRARAALALGRIQDAASAGSLAILSDDADPWVVDTALFALGQLGLASGTHAIEPAVEACSRHATAGEPDLVARAIECLGKQAPGDGATRIDTAFDHPDARVRAAAADAAMRLRFVPTWRGESERPPEWPDALVVRLDGALGDADVTVRRAAAHAASRYGEPRLVATLERALDDADATVRLFAARALGRSGVPESGHALAQACADPDAGVRTEAVAALEALGASDRIPADLARDPSFHVRARLAAALGGSERSDGVALLTTLLDDESTTVVAAAVEAASTIPGGPGIDAVLARVADPRWPVRVAAARAAGRLGDGGWAALERLATDDDPRVRAAVVEGVEGREDDPRAQRWIRAALTGPSLAERGTAVARMAASHAPDRIERLVEAHDGATGPDGAEIREAIRTALAEDPDPASRALRARSTADQPAEPPFGPWEEGEAPVVAIDTDKGSFEIRLLPEAAPFHVANFVGLIREGFYDGLPWHRVVPDFVIQGGDPEGTGWGGPGWALPDEISTTPFARGTVGMPKSAKDTGGCQIFVTHVPTPHLDGNYTVFGEVVSGIDVIDRIEVGDRILFARVAGEAPR